MRSFLKLGGALLALSIAAPALAQTTPPAPPAEAAAPATPAAAPVAVGQPVKDSTGATIGEVTEVKADASGKTMATIKMGADTFAVDTTALAVRDGATLINATQAEIKAMMKK